MFRHLGLGAESVEFETRSGRLAVSLVDDVLTLDYPSRPGVGCEAPPGLAAGIGATPVHTAKARDFLAVFESEDVVRDLKPNMAVLMRLDCLGIIATAPGNDCDCVSRFFAPRAGVHEDPVIGSSHCTLIPYRAARLQKRRALSPTTLATRR